MKIFPSFNLLQYALNSLNTCKSFCIIQTLVNLYHTVAVTYILSAHSDSLGKQTAPTELEFITKVCKERLLQSTLFIFFVEAGNFALSVWVGSQSVLLHRTIRSGQQVPAKKMKCYLSKVKFFIPRKNLSVLCLVIFAGCGNILFCPNC